LLKRPGTSTILAGQPKDSPLRVGSKTAVGLPQNVSRVRMKSQVKASSIFLYAMVLLCIAGAATYLSLSYARASERWVSHTQEVRATLGDLEATLNDAARARMDFLMSGSEPRLNEYRRFVARVPAELNQLCELSKDNPVQTTHCHELESVTRQRLQAFEVTIAQKEKGQPVDLASIVQEGTTLAGQSAAVTGAIRAEEGPLLKQRGRLAQRRFLLASVVVVASFVLALSLLYLNYRLLTAELRARAKAEEAVRSAYQRESGLRQEQERFRLFLQAVKDYAIYVLDARGNVASWNLGAERIKGYTASEIIGRNFSCFFTKEDLAAGKPAEEMMIAVRDGQFEGEGWRVRKDGSRFWASVVLTAIKNEKGEVVGFTKVTRDVTERMRTQEKLREANAELAAQVAQRLSAEEKLAGSEQSLRELSHHLLRTQDEERRRIGRELHDSLGQYLAILKMNMESLQSFLGGNHDGVSEQVTRCVRLLEDSIREMRTISYLLYPPMLEEVGLKSAIPWYLEGFSKRSKIQTTFELDTSLGRLPADVELALFRVLQESLTNVHRHSGSLTANIRLCKQDDMAVLEIKDQGKGIPSKLLEESGADWLGSLGVGLRGMKERMRQLGGKLDVSSAEDGTIVTASVQMETPLSVPAYPKVPVS
jgi:PAS domain S-box-containing protein